MKPSVGRIVHYLPLEADADTACMAAVVTFVCHDGNVALQVFYPPLVNHVDEQELASVPEYRLGHLRGGTWHWPERVEHVPGERPPRY